jgi:hypothetical protein
MRTAFTTCLCLIGSLMSALHLFAAPDGSLPPFLLDVKGLDARSVSRNATKALTNTITTIIEKPRPSPTGDAHDYVSYGRYWWTNPATSNGLPYIQRDGHPNREQMALGDHVRLDEMIKTVEALARGWNLEGREDCAHRAGEWIRAWFVSPDTRLNPEFEYAQIRLGRDDNRGTASGLIDTRGFLRLIDSLRMLHGSPALGQQDEKAVQKWFGDHLHWLTTSGNGKREHNAANNHGSWNLAQCIAISRYLGREDEARRFANEDFARIASQFMPDGSQPLEIVRVDGLSYSVFNLEAQFAIAKLASPLGVDLWHYESSNGASLRKGLDFLRPYDQSPQTWPHNQLKKIEPGFLYPLLTQSALVWSEKTTAPGQNLNTNTSTKTP